MTSEDRYSSLPDAARVVVVTRAMRIAVEVVDHYPKWQRWIVRRLIRMEFAYRLATRCYFGGYFDGMTEQRSVNEQAKRAAHDDMAAPIRGIKI